MHDALAVVLIMLTVLMALCVVAFLALMILIAVFWRKAHKRIQTITNAVNRSVILDEPVRLDGVFVNKDEAEEIKAYVRQNKERSARDSATLDTATRFHRDI